ncbi:MAG TPA: hypothetical protein VGI81_03740 [Tepidisphaeraceae bacterium]|jgi:hypothetical protein
MLASNPPTRPLDYAAAPRAEGRRWRHALGWTATIANGVVALGCVVFATQLAPQFGDATSIHGVIVPLVFFKLPLTVAASTALSIAAKGTNRAVSRVSSAFTWAIVAVWITIAFLLFRP